MGAAVHGAAAPSRPSAFQITPCSRSFTAMKSRRLPGALVMALFACTPVDSFLHGSAHLRFDRAGASGGQLLDVPVEATYCAADTTLTIVGADRSWSVAIALRTPWPSRSLEFALDSMVGGPGTAAVAIRPLKDSVGIAMTTVSGSLKLDAGPKASGRLDLVAKSDRDTVRLVGTLAAVSVAPGGCPTP